MPTNLPRRSLFRFFTHLLAGDLSLGFARCWCPVCRVSYLVPT
jgi:hypothetical protein